MSDSRLGTRPSHMYVDATVGGYVVFTNIDADSLDSCVIEMTPATAAKLAHRLLDTAARLEEP